MNVTRSAISLNVADLAASAAFVKAHFGFAEEMAADGFSSLAREGVGFNLVFLIVYQLVQWVTEAGGSAG